MAALSPVTAAVPGADLTPAPAPAAPGRETRLGVLVIPALAFFLAFAFIPMVGVLLLSFTNWNGITAIQFAGWESWTAVFRDPQTYRSLGLTFGLMIATWLVQTPISLLLGVFVAGHQRYRSAVAGAFFFALAEFLAPGGPRV